MEKEPNPFKEPNPLEVLEEARKQFLEGDLSDLDFEIEELENRLAFRLTTEGGSDGCYSDCGPCIH